MRNVLLSEMVQQKRDCVKVKVETRYVEPYKIFNLQIENEQFIV